MRRGGEPAILAFISLVFITVHIALIVFAVDGGHRQPDSLDYLAQIESLFRDAGPGANKLSSVARQPGYAAILGLVARAGIPNPDFLLVIVQIFALWFTGLVTRSIVRRYLPSMGTIAFALVVLNPNAMGMAQLLLPVTIFTLLLTISFRQLLLVVEEGHWRSVASLGIAMGIAVLFRPEVQFAIIFLPAIIGLLTMLALKRRVVLHRLSQGIVATAIALVVASPWAFVVHDVTGRVKLSGGSGSQVFVAMNVAFAERRVNPSLSLSETFDVVTERARVASGDSNPGTSTYTKMLLNYPTIQLAEMYVTSQVKWLASGGAQNLHGLLGLKSESSHAIYARGSHSNRLSAWAASLGEASFPALGLTALAVGFAILGRVLGLAGVIALFRRRQWFLLVTIVGSLLYYSAMLIFNGLSRYRIPVEPILAILAVYGIDGIRSDVVRMMRKTSSRLRRNMIWLR